MSDLHQRVMLVGQFGPGALELSYETAFRELGCQVRRFDMAAAVNRYCRLGYAGRLFNAFVPVEPWIRKANRELIREVRQFLPQVIVVFGKSPVRAGTLAQIRTDSMAKTGLIWPDPLTELGNASATCLPIYNLVATFSKSTVNAFLQLGAGKAAWIPLAGDPYMHSPAQLSDSEQALYAADVAFIGGWGHDREEILSDLSDFEVKIWGPDWGRHARHNPVIRRFWQKRPVYEGEFAKVISASKININVIRSEGPATANMRFFEISMAGGLQVCSNCPDMDSEFKHGETIFYYRDVQELIRLVRKLLDDEPLRWQVAEAARQKVLAAHTYTHRARQILEVLDEL